MGLKWVVVAGTLVLLLAGCGAQADASPNLTSGTVWVSIAGIAAQVIIMIFNILYTARAAKERRHQDEEADEKHRIVETTLELLRWLDIYRSWEYDSYKAIAKNRGVAVEDLHSSLHVAAYAWELAVSPRIGSGPREDVTKLREEIASVHSATALSIGPDKSKVPNLVHQVIKIGNLALGRKSD